RAVALKSSAPGALPPKASPPERYRHVHAGWRDCVPRCVLRIATQKLATGPEETMSAVLKNEVPGRYAHCIEVSKRIRWEIERDVFRGRRFDFECDFLPDGLSQVDRLDFLAPAERRLMSQIQGRTYAYLFGLVERFI